MNERACFKSRSSFGLPWGYARSSFGVGEADPGDRESGKLNEDEEGNNDGGEDEEDDNKDYENDDEDDKKSWKFFENLR